jgi:hypothetical protein
MQITAGCASRDAMHAMIAAAAPAAACECLRR